MCMLSAAATGHTLDCSTCSRTRAGCWGWVLLVFAAETPETVIYHPAALSMKYFFDQYDFESGGALAALTLGLTVKELWRRQWPRFLARQVWPVGHQFL